MKIRHGFVSNSSSSSFVLDVEGVSPVHREMIRKHIEVSMVLGWDGACEGEQWSIREDGDRWFCMTIMDNFNLKKYLCEVVDLSKDRFSEEDEGHW